MCRIGPVRRFPYISAAQVLAGKAPLAQLENRIVLLGSTAPGLADLRVTPFSSTFPGVEIHAHLIAGMLDGTTRYTPPWADDARVLVVLVLGVLLTLVLLRFNPIIGLVVSMGLLALLLAAYAAAWTRFWVVPMAAPMITVLGLYALNTAYGFFAESRNKRQMTKLFGQYVPPELAAEMSQDPAHYTMDGQSRDMTVLFSDIRGFTNFSEKLSPAELAEVLNAYLSTMTRIVQQQRGTIDKYIGDAIMAFWNAPVDLTDHATPRGADRTRHAGCVAATQPGIRRARLARGADRRRRQHRAHERRQHGFGISHVLHRHGRRGEPGLASGRHHQAIWRRHPGDPAHRRGRPGARLHENRRRARQGQGNPGGNL